MASTKGKFGKLGGAVGGLFSSTRADDHLILRELDPVDRERKAYVDNVENTLAEYKNSLKKLQTVLKRLLDKAGAAAKAEQQFALATRNCCPENLRIPSRYQYSKVCSDLGEHFDCEAKHMDAFLISKLTQRLSDQMNSFNSDLERVKDLRRQHDKAYEELSHLIGRKDNYTKTNFAKIKMDELYKLCKDISKAQRHYRNILDEVELKYLEIELNVLKNFLQEYRLYLSNQRDLCAQIHQSSLTQFFGTSDVLEWCRLQENEFRMMVEERAKHDIAEDEDKEIKREKQFVSFLASNEMCRVIAEYSRKDPSCAKSVLFPGIAFLCEQYDISAAHVNAYLPESRRSNQSKGQVKSEILHTFEKDLETFVQILKQPQYSMDTLLTLTQELARFRMSPYS
eukprot:CAMPEP_0201483112 /NCGR_PEP_ID=MMETSP0151_2-20130828/7341_1 /ASSEMBLY_ACC=CAM_ASM_000257 /TAXON_ID=200890 /ORGANISM="Paramoeba atlantica, Strain 621/1 / CCAP 1560/9" /LENGTH=396 /DNA_ID=CAMNT_0047866099 /DNA_START=75 /DNA_END=1265 /DNA_ORIENTATION=-